MEPRLKDSDGTPLNQVVIEGQDLGTIREKRLTPALRAYTSKTAPDIRPSYELLYWDGRAEVDEKTIVYDNYTKAGATTFYGTMPKQILTIFDKKVPQDIFVKNWIWRLQMTDKEFKSKGLDLGVRYAARVWSGFWENVNVVFQRVKVGGEDIIIPYRDEGYDCVITSTLTSIEKGTPEYWVFVRGQQFWHHRKVDKLPPTCLKKYNAGVRAVAWEVYMTDDEITPEWIKEWEAAKTSKNRGAVEHKLLDQVDVISKKNLGLDDLPLDFLSPPLGNADSIKPPAFVSEEGLLWFPWFHKGINGETMEQTENGIDLVVGDKIATLTGWNIGYSEGTLHTQQHYAPTSKYSGNEPQVVPLKMRRAAEAKTEEELLAEEERKMEDLMLAEYELELEMIRQYAKELEELKKAEPKPKAPRPSRIYMDARAPARGAYEEASPEKAKPKKRKPISEDVLKAVYGTVIENL